MLGFSANHSIREDDYSPDLSINAAVSTDSPETIATTVFDSNPEATMTNSVTEAGCGATIHRTDSASDYFRPGTAPAVGTTVVEILEKGGRKYVLIASIFDHTPAEPVLRRPARRLGLLVTFH
jgi:hypothetical protein